MKPIVEALERNLSVCIVSGRCEVVGALFWREEIDEAVNSLHSPSTIRSAAFRRSVFSLAKAFSIGLKSGL